MFNINTIYYNLLSAMTKIIGFNWPLVKNEAEASLTNYMSYLNALAIGVEQGLITPAEALEQVKKLPELLKADLFAFEIIGEGIIQTAANSVLDILIGAITAIVPAPAIKI